jgi:hypothetical protein
MLGFGAIGEDTIAGPVASVTLPTLVQPSSDISAGSWTPSTGATLFGCIDETPYSDTDYISVAVGSTCEVGLPPFAFPVTAGVTLSFRANSNAASTITISLKQNGSVITGTTACTWVHAALSSGFAQIDDTLTTSQAAAITDPSVHPVSVVITAS